MTSRPPVIRQSSGLATILQIAALVAAFLAARLYGGPYAALAVSAAYLGYAVVARSIFVGYHKRGMLLFREGKYREAIAEFEKSYADLLRRPWIDRYRAIVLLSPSAIAYREMALVNRGFCHAQLGEKDEARKAYRQALEEFPGSAIATSALKFLE